MNYHDLSLCGNKVNAVVGPIITQNPLYKIQIICYQKLLSRAATITIGFLVLSTLIYLIVTFPSQIINSDKEYHFAVRNAY